MSARVCTICSERKKIIPKLGSQCRAMVVLNPSYNGVQGKGRGERRCRNSSQSPALSILSKAPALEVGTFVSSEPVIVIVAALWSATRQTTKFNLADQLTLMQHRTRASPRLFQGHTSQRSPLNRRSTLILSLETPPPNRDSSQHNPRLNHEVAAIPKAVASRIALEEPNSLHMHPSIIAHGRCDVQSQHEPIVKNEDLSTGRKLQQGGS